MALRDLTDRSAVLAAIAEADELGEPEFLRKYGFEPPRQYLIDHDGRRYASKAILAAAHGIQFPQQAPLRSSDFSGGRETTDKARALGFIIVETDATRDDLRLSLARFMELFREARTARFGHDHPAVEALRGCASGIDALLPPSLSGAVVRPSVGQGNWAAVPWIAVLHPDVTTTTQHGVYPVLLFREDLTAVEVTIAQGVTALKKSLGRREAVHELDRRATALRRDLEDLRSLGFISTRISSLGRPSLHGTTWHRQWCHRQLRGSLYLGVGRVGSHGLSARGLWAPVAGRHAETARDI